MGREAGVAWAPGAHRLTMKMAAGALFASAGSYDFCRVGACTYADGERSGSKRGCKHPPYDTARRSLTRPHRLHNITNQSVSNLMSVIQDSPAPATKRARRKEARPGELLEAALALFVEKGYAATRVE